MVFTTRFAGGFGARDYRQTAAGGNAGGFGGRGRNQGGHGGARGFGGGENLRIIFQEFPAYILVLKAQNCVGFFSPILYI